jgi:hypothetical protein
VTNLQNELPIAVHHASGGDARVRVAGSTISLHNVSSGSFVMTNASRFRIVANLRTMPSIFILVGYTNPVTLANASAVMTDLNTFIDDVPEGATVYFTLLDMMTLSPTPGEANDYLHVSLYG